ncbi:MAG TPA: helix-turn-helix transcriptional regulator [Thermoanaerobaculia bacterium]|jgi:XRE family transcriptional regulator of biofilm formation
MATLGERVRELRERQRLTQEQLAERSGISKGFLSDLENHKRNPSAEYILRIANALGASVDYLLSGEDRDDRSFEPVVIPRELSQVAEELRLTHTETLELLEAHNSVVARRSDRGMRRFTADDWRKLYEAFKKVFG